MHKHNFNFKFTSTQLIDGAKKRFNELSPEYNLDWKSFYNGWVESRSDLIKKEPSFLSMVKSIFKPNNQ